ncbi:hypothetical protein ACYOEI_04850 [Singulisphaera rosea]
MTKPYTYSRGTDGCDKTFDILDGDGEMLVAIHFWERETEAEADAKLIVNALNAYQPKE